MKTQRRLRQMRQGRQRARRVIWSGLQGRGWEGKGRSRGGGPGEGNAQKAA